MMVMVIIMLAITDVDEHDGDHNEADYILAYLQPNFQINLYLSVQYDSPLFPS